MTDERAQIVVGLGSFAAVVIGPLSLVAPVFFYSPLDAGSWWRALAAGAAAALVPVALVMVLVGRGALTRPQAALGAGLLFTGVTCLVGAVALIANGAFDTRAPAPHRLLVKDAWRDCSTYRAQNSTSRIERCDLYASFSFPDGGRGPLAKVELPEGSSLAAGDSVEATLRGGAFGWSWGLRFDPSPPISDPGGRP